jgi:hypothetical protein
MGPGVRVALGLAKVVDIIVKMGCFLCVYVCEFHR